MYINLKKRKLEYCGVISSNISLGVPLKRLRIITLISVLVFTSHSYGEQTAEIIQQGEVRLNQNQGAQNEIDQVNQKTKDLADEYYSTLKVVDGLKVYNRLLAKQLDNQDQEVEKIRTSITNAAIIERQILPLLVRMVAGLKDFVSLDMPFLLDERFKRIQTLESVITLSDVTSAEKARRVFEAFQIETEYGNTIEAYKGKLNLDGKTYDVDFLRVGRIAFMYRTVGSEDYGYWDSSLNAWQVVDTSQFKLNFDKGVKVAKQELAPELFTLPIRNVGAIQ